MCPGSYTLQGRRCTMKYTIPRTNGTRIITFIVPYMSMKPSLRRGNTSNRSTVGRSSPICFPEKRFLRYSTLSGTKCDPFLVSNSRLLNRLCSWIDSVTYSRSRMQPVGDFHAISTIINSTAPRQIKQSLSRLSMFCRGYDHQLLVRDEL